MHYATWFISPYSIHSFIYSSRLLSLRGVCQWARKYWFAAARKQASWELNKHTRARRPIWQAILFSFEPLSLEKYLYSTSQPVSQSQKDADDDTGLRKQQQRKISDRLAFLGHWWLPSHQVSWICTKKRKKRNWMVFMTLPVGRSMVSILKCVSPEPRPRSISATQEARKATNRTNERTSEQASNLATVMLISINQNLFLFFFTSFACLFACCCFKNRKSEKLILLQLVNKYTASL